MADALSNFFTPHRVVTILSIAAVAIVIGYAVTRGLYVLLRFQTDWKTLAQKFPATDAHKFGGRYNRQSGCFYRTGNRINGVFRIELAHEGLLITADFAGRSPILIPWPAIRDVTETNLGFLSKAMLSVDYEKELKFTLPVKALKEIQQNVPTDRFHKTSFSELIKKRLTS